MSGGTLEGKKFSRFKAGSRRTVRVSQQEIVRTGFLPGCEGFPLVVEPAMENVQLLGWARDRREWIEERLLAHGAILFRGFGVESVEAFQEVARAVCGELLDYLERAAPRREVSRQVFTSTEFPADQWIPLHHEMSYSHNWPIKLWFYCAQPAAEGGATPLVDDRPFLDRLDPDLKEPFLARKVLYVRNYGEGVDLPWQEVFQTTDRAEVEAYCRASHMRFEWRDGDRLRTWAVRQAVATHPKTGQQVWFNHAHMFHASNLDPAVREALLSEFAPDELPRNAFYGDGTPIEDAVVHEIRRSYLEASVRFPWQQGDLLLVDNFLASHGREPYRGPRKIVVAMAELYANQDLGA